MTKTMKRILLLFAGGLLMLLLPGPHGPWAADEGGPSSGERPTVRPNIVYVADFSLDVDAREKGERRSRSPLRIRERLKDLTDQSDETPDEKAKKIVDALGRAIVAALIDKGVNAKRLEGQGGPSSGSWLLEGEFVEYGEGDRMKRAVIGFGSGAATMEVRAKLSEVVDGGVRPLFDSTVGGKKNRMPGAAITRNPYAAAAKFVVTKNAPDRDVKKLGGQIADTLYEYMEKQGFARP